MTDPRLPDHREDSRVANRRMLKRLCVVAVAMFGFGWVGALVLGQRASEKWNEPEWVGQARSM